MPVTDANGVVRFGRPLRERELGQVNMDRVMDGFGDEKHDQAWLEDGLDELGRLAAKTASEAESHAVVCVWCQGKEPAVNNCETCAGRGRVMSVPYPDRPWDLILGTGRDGSIPPYPHRTVPKLRGSLWLGGHYCQAGAMTCAPRDEFDTVISLHKSIKDWYVPTNGAKLYDYSMPDAALSPAHAGNLDFLAENAVRRAMKGDQVLIRCRAGINRSGLIMGLALLKLGYTSKEAMNMMRVARSPYVLFNDSFVAHIRRTEMKRASQ